MTATTNLSSYYFNPRSREGSDTACLLAIVRTNDISIHAPAKGATPFIPTEAQTDTDFNPRSREGSDSKNHQDYSQ